MDATLYLAFFAATTVMILLPGPSVMLTAAIIRLAGQYGRYGYRRITAMLLVEGWVVNHKRVEAHLAA